MGLIFALSGLVLKPGEKVVLPSFTFVATARRADRACQRHDSNKAEFVQPDARLRHGQALKPADAPPPP